MGYSLVKVTKLKIDWEKLIMGENGSNEKHNDLLLKQLSTGMSPSGGLVSKAG